MSYRPAYVLPHKHRLTAFLASNVLLALLWLPAATANEAAGTGSADSGPVATTMPSSKIENFALWQDSEFSTFFYDTTADFSQYDQAVFFPMTFDRMALTGAGNNEYIASWEKSTFEEMDEICQFFDDYIQKTFKRSDVLQATQRGGPNVLAIEFRMKDFMPTSMRREDALDTVGESRNRLGVGTLTFQAVLVESQTGKLVAVIEDGLEIKSSSYAADDRVGRNLAWKRSFQRVVQKLRDDIETRQAI
ncbi:hypothetical protein [Gilvimarinus algae]|uniref:DUF3313 domain-containing protein n=1 Tax=Gilvimarinus algae TaxID=3058037 RepID=A0ABT8T905_9GAMM|nr:hypothetical protein [Gilvimarinus sp. SDUM040014]MDO3380611.1 hypothetical protein [Gilvimarinus sp. SDUM040014]